MSDAAKEKLASFKGVAASSSSTSSATPAPLHSSILFPELAKEINADPVSTANLKGLFIVTVLKKGNAVDEWYLLFQGRDGPAIGATKSTEQIPVVAFVSGRIRVVGDMQAAFQLEEVFVKAGGVEKTLRFIKDHNILLPRWKEG
ncbi:hypothetical protein BC829DRAFT_395573 [Chytridium lagenaria]|nr:hypothetical protein BC829DRAFT_395573 [Chytridium lagenaria]